MQLPNAIRFGGWFFLILILLLGIGTIAVFTRMSPAIETILKQNEKSLRSCEEMLVALVQIQNQAPLVDSDQQATNDSNLSRRFRKAYETAAGNVTEQGEQQELDSIESHWKNAMQGDEEATAKIVASILQLSKINRNAMRTADDRARRLGNAGAWGVVFMTLTVFTIGLIYLRTVANQLITPLTEVYDVVVKAKDEPFRRCGRQNDRADIQLLYERINELLDE
ncbi:MAG: hypothetical protein AAF939_06640 [Planctomycetota bacterium]